MLEPIHQSAVKKLLTVGINYKGYKGLIDYLDAQTSAPNWDTLLITHPTLKEKYWQVWLDLNRELVPTHISPEVLYRKLWDLFREVVSNKAAFQSKVKLQQRIYDFSKEVKKPLIAFDVIYEISNFSIGAQHFTLGNVEVFKLTSDYLQSLALNKQVSLSLMQSGTASRWEGRFVAKVEVEASDPDRARDSGEIEVNNALNILRLAVRKELISEVSEDTFLWELGEWIAIPKVKPEVGTLLTIGSGHRVRPLIIDVGDSIAKTLEGESIWKCILNGKLPEDIRRRLARAIEWISHSITANGFDYKLVELCTALEILLLPDYRRGPKGALIALRQVLIGRGVFYNPTAILHLYNKRSHIIHGGYLDITSYSDYWHLLICCLMVLESIVRLSQRYLCKHDMEALLSTVENKETLEAFVKSCERGMYKGRGIGDVKKAAKARLGQCQ